MTLWQGVNLNMDHVVPIARGGLHCADNLRPACVRCNASKRASLLDDYLTRRDRAKRAMG